MASTKTSVNIADIPCFNGHAYQQWVDKMHGIFLITNTTFVIDSTLVPNAAGTEPTEPTQPPPSGANTVDWTTYQAKFQTYSTKMAEWRKKDSDYAAENSKAKGIFAMALDIGIWEQVKEKTAKEIFDWLKDKYGKEAFIEVLEDF